MEKTVVVFRADGNASLGSGHVMRCLSVAAALRARGAECRFVTADEAMHGVIARQGFAAHSLGTVWNEPAREWPALLPLLVQLAPACVVVDHYSVDGAYFAALSQKIPAVFLTDFNTFSPDVRLLVNYNLYAPQLAYAHGGAGQPQELLLGPRYAPLRAEFAHCPQRAAQSGTHNVLVSTGGADPEDVAGQLLRALQRGQGPQNTIFHVVAGALHPRLAALQALARTLPQVRIHTDVQCMSALMLSCDAAIAAAGSTLYELCACGVPAVTYALADNQLPGAAAFAAAGLMRSAGDAREQGNAFAPHALALLEELLDDAPARAAMAAAMQRTVDGLGAGRLAEAVLGCCAAR